jgi:hypothetical protein
MPQGGPPLDKQHQMREVMRPLRALGSRRGHPGREHDMFFAPLLEARLNAQLAQDYGARLRAFDGSSLTTAIDKALHSIAADHFPDDTPHRRGLYESLREESEPLFLVVQRVAEAAALVREGEAQLRESDSGAQVREWNAWLDAIVELFAVADRVWLACVPLVAVRPARRPGLWQRIVGSFRR